MMSNTTRMYDRRDLVAENTIPRYIEILPATLCRFRPDRTTKEESCRWQ